MFSFTWPWLFLVLPLPIAVWRFAPRAENSGPALRLAWSPLWARLVTSRSRPRGSRRGRHLLLVLVWLLLVVAAARPQWIGDPATLPASGRDLMLAVDISGSMGTEDMRVEGGYVTRLRAVKQVVSEFVQRRQGDRLGLILFGSQAYLQAPLTFDRETVGQLLREAPVGIAGGKTAIGDAIGLAVKRLRKRPETARVVVLLTDGANNSGEVTPQKAAELAAHEGIRIYTIGIGANEMILPGLFGSAFGARRVNPSAELDEDTLTAIADVTAGRYFRALDPEQLQAVYETLDALEPIEQESEVLRPTASLFHYPLAAAVLLSFLLLPARLVRSALRWPMPGRAEGGVGS